MKGYDRKQTLHYNRQRTIKLKGKLHQKLGKKPGGFWSQAISPVKKTTSSIGANIADLTHFLARYLSGEQNVAVVPQGSTFSASFYRSPQTRRPYWQLNVPPWDSYDLPLKTGFDKYRIYRSGIWHETCHIRFTDPELFNWPNHLAQNVFNIVEDRRVEDLGAEQWPGYLPERLYSHAYGWALRPSVDTIQDRDERIGEAFLQRVIVGKVKGKLPPDEAKLVEDVAQYVEKELKRINKETERFKKVAMQRALVAEVIKQLQFKQYPSDESPFKSYGTKSPWEATFTERYTSANPTDPKDVEEKMEEYFKEVEKKAKSKPSGKDGEKTDPKEVTDEDVETARHGSAEVKGEYDSAQKGKAIDPLLVSFQRVITHGPASMYKDERFITDMNTHLRKYKTGYEVVLGKSGARLSIPDYIRYQEEPFATRLKKSVKGKKLLVITDFSGSMAPREEEYKRAIISAMEVLNGVGSQIALFGFGDDPAQGEIFFQVKTFNEPKWTRTHAAKVAGLTAGYGCTPTDRAYSHLANYIKKHKPDVTVTITDGLPDRVPATQVEIARLKKHTRMVAFGIAPDEAEAKEMANRLKELGYHQSVAVSDLRQLPPKLVKLFIPE